MNLVSHLVTQEISCGATYERNSDQDKEYHDSIMDFQEFDDICYDNYDRVQIF